MTDNMHAEQQLQRLYNQTKNQRSPVDLDELILGKVRVLEEKPVPVTSEKLWVYLPIAASLLLVFLLQSHGGDKTENRLQKPLEVVQLPIEKKRAAK